LGPVGATNYTVQRVHVQHVQHAVQ